MRQQARIGAALLLLALVAFQAPVAMAASGGNQGGRGSAAAASAPRVSASSHTGSMISASESSNGKAIRVRVGAVVSITLHSMYWQMGKAPQTSTLRSLGAVVSTPIMPGPDAPAGCQVPGTGCGTLEWKFKALRPGVTAFTASRTSCGEAMRCSPSESAFKVTIRVER